MAAATAPIALKEALLVRALMTAPIAGCCAALDACGIHIGLP